MTEKNKTGPAWALQYHAEWLEVQVAKCEENMSKHQQGSSLYKQYEHDKRAFRYCSHMLEEHKKKFKA